MSQHGMDEEFANALRGELVNQVTAAKPAVKHRRIGMGVGLGLGIAIAGGGAVAVATGVWGSFNGLTPGELRLRGM